MLTRSPLKEKHFNKKVKITPFEFRYFAYFLARHASKRYRLEAGPCLWLSHLCSLYFFSCFQQTKIHFLHFDLPVFSSREAHTHADVCQILLTQSPNLCASELLSNLLSEFLSLHLSF